MLHTDLGILILYSWIQYQNLALISRPEDALPVLAVLLIVRIFCIKSAHDPSSMSLKFSYSRVIKNRAVKILKVRSFKRCKDSFFAKLESIVYFFK